MSNLFRSKKSVPQANKEKEEISEKILLVMEQFESIRFSTTYQNDITSLNEVIRLGEYLLEIAPHGKYKDVVPHAAFHLLHPYDVRARYYRHYGNYDKVKTPKNIQQSISDYSRVIDLLPIAFDESQKESYESKSRSAYEGRCVCYLENELWSNALNDAKIIVSKHEDSQAYILRGKCYFSAGVLDLANEDIVQAIKISKSQWDLLEAVELQKAIQGKFRQLNNAQAISNQINISGNVSGSTIITGNENIIQSTTEESD
jgi:tetratricopeptide (TPR) repeat protein